MKSWISHVIYWVSECLYGYGMVVCVPFFFFFFLPWWSHGWLGAEAHWCCPASWKSKTLNTVSLGKDHDSKLKIRFLLKVYHFCVCVLSHVQLFVTLSTVALQEIFLTQGLNPRLLHWQAGSSPLNHQESLISFSNHCKVKKF